MRPRQAQADLFPLDSAAFNASSAAAAALSAPVPGATPASATTVTALTYLVRDVLEGTVLPLWVRGEVSDFKSSRNGHWYFTLRDDSTQLRCVVWSREAVRIKTPPAEGRQVVVRGQLTVYPARGEMQFAVTDVELLGAGARRAAVERTLRALEKDGLLADERKRALPSCPRRIAVVTSPDGAAIRDVIAVVARRAPSVEVVVVAARVQGAGAPDALCVALASVSRWAGADTVIIGRGGGAKDDLSAFDDERVARALAACPIPTISAVGHEIDLTVCDLVADHRSPTPSAAAEAAVPAELDLRARLEAAGADLTAAAVRRVREAHTSLSRTARHVHRSASVAVERRAARLAAAAARVQALSPLGTLARGYAVAREIDGGPAMTTVAQFAPGAPFDLILADGVVRSRVEGAH
ncbi:MAG TPA: exodeoxyribonuclease VII large subunit [Gemmatimonadaceae bacterium]|nr:exodeoxyribonuclease VII large subunit [Gemmatimonadaceae bacterium]